MERAAPERRLSLAQQLVLELSQKIISGELPAGSKLPTEQAFTEERGVSRTVVREAMSRLQAEGLVETRRGIGTFVVDAIRPGELQDGLQDSGDAHDAVAITELRLSLEVEAAALAARRVTPEQLQVIRHALEKANQVGLRHKDCAAIEFDFHLQIALCTGNRFFCDAMTHMSKALIGATQVATDERIRHLQAREREQIYAALEQRDADVARAAMLLHLTNRLYQARNAADRDLRDLY